MDAILLVHQLIHSQLGSVFNISNSILSPSHFSQNCKRISKGEAMEDIGNITLWADVQVWNFKMLHFKDAFSWTNFLTEQLWKLGGQSHYEMKVRDKECQHVVVVVGWKREIWQDDGWYLLWSQTLSMLQVRPGAPAQLFTKFWRETWNF